MSDKDENWPINPDGTLDIEAWAKSIRARRQGGAVMEDDSDRIAFLEDELGCALADKEALGKEVDKLKKLLSNTVKAVEAKDDLLVCYRLGRRPSEALFKRLERADKAMTAAKEML